MTFIKSTSRFTWFYILSMVLAAGCGEEQAETTAAATYTLGTVQSIDKSLLEGDRFSKILLNDKGNLAYVLNDKGAVFRVSIEKGVTDFLNKKNWTKLELKDDSKDGTAGAAKLDQVETAPSDRNIVLTKNGVLVLARLSAPHPGGITVGALAYFQNGATTPTYAWTNQEEHVGQGINAALAHNNLWFSVHAVVRGDKEMFVVSNITRTSAVPASKNQFIGTINMAFPHLVANNDTLFGIDQSGVVTLPLSELGDGVKDVAPPTAGASSSNWKMNSAVNNRRIRNVVLHNGRIYIALERIGNDTGGIAVYDIASQKTTPPNRAIWNGSEAHGLMVYQNRLRAIVRGNLVEIKDDGSIGNTIFSVVNAQNNKYRPELEAVGRTLYRGELTRLTELDGKIQMITNIGQDLIIQVAYVRGHVAQFVITHEQMPLKQKSKKD